VSGVATPVYDAGNRLTSKQFGGVSQTTMRLDIAYNQDNQILTESRYTDLAGHTSAGTSNFTYDNGGRLTHLTELTGSSVNMSNFTYAYDAANRLTSEQLNGTTTGYQYDDASQLTQAGAATFGYDAAGNRNNTGYQTNPGNQMTNDGVWTYTYDFEGNITKKSKGASAETWVSSGAQTQPASGA
jgi:YD repeat-containing protein